MKQVPNDIISTLVRSLPHILSNMDDEAVRHNTRLNNAVRLTSKAYKRLKKIDEEK